MDLQCVSSRHPGPRAPKSARNSEDFLAGIDLQGESIRCCGATCYEIRSGEMDRRGGETPKKPKFACQEWTPSGGVLMRTKVSVLWVTGICDDRA